MKPTIRLGTLRTCVLAMLVFVSGMLLGAPAAEAQPMPAVGERVRLTVQGLPNEFRSRLVGTLRHVSPDTVTLDAGGRARNIPLAIVQRVEVSVGKRRMTSEGALIGAIAGSAALGGILAAKSDGCAPGSFCFEPTPAEGLAIGVVLGALGGVTLGALIGHAILADRWVPASKWLTQHAAVEYRASAHHHPPSGHLGVTKRTSRRPGTRQNKRR